MVAFQDEYEAERILHRTRLEAPKAVRLANALDEEIADRLRTAGAHIVFPESLAAGLGLAAQSLRLCGLDETAIEIALLKLRDRLGQKLRADGATGMSPSRRSSSADTSALTADTQS